jgi:hypothetical protein
VPRMPTQMSALTVRQQIVKFTGQAQMGTIAAKVNTYRIINDLSLHIIGGSFAKPSIACATSLGRAVHRAFFFIFLKLLRYSARIARNCSLDLRFGER